MTTAVKIWKTGQELYSLNVTASGAVPALTTLASTQTSVTKGLSAGAFQINQYIDVKDQYGVSIPLSSIPGGLTYMSTKSSVASVNSSGIVTPITVGTCEIRIYFSGSDRTLVINLTIN
jgi:hypothetical protein